jgi:hypothetical protein
MRHSDHTIAAAVGAPSSATIGSLIRRLAMAALLLTALTFLASIALVSQP